ncbi:MULTISPECIES: hypothetical protein [Actinoalloteichus]|uniref:Uncharacterized protein n=1 Tax=Actinoalloteichus fjordicus TaxID=1612552 RepID=A0AAC9L9Q3_9PSEU|nr:MULTISPECIES: hypothetical protein [Actinoalloteichus]APU13923.1 hypothetical protein UA74_09295 [Actinoalloteichus fjordicus]APU19869.1 hypothetical protein UA75_09265 [Actinoalloteichus sp. GBA129-24]
MERSVVVDLLAGWDMGPFYYHVEDDPGGFDYSVEQAGEFLRLPAELIRELKSWDDELQATYDEDGDGESEFPSAELEEAWRERGKVLAARIKQESPVVARVNYWANGEIPDGIYIY